MTESKSSHSTSSVGSDDSLVLIESADVPAITESSSETPPPAITATFSDDESPQPEWQGTEAAIFVTDVQIVDDILSSS